jgi:hypothetical protein
MSRQNCQSDGTHLVHSWNIQNYYPILSHFMHMYTHTLTHITNESNRERRITLAKKTLLPINNTHTLLTTTAIKYCYLSLFSLQ